MSEILILNHANGAPGLRWFGLGPKLKPNKGLKKLQSLFAANAFWAKNRNETHIKKMLKNSVSIVSVWNKDRLIGFGRATSDQIYRAVLWDIVISHDMQGLGLGKTVLEEILKNEHIKNVEKVYLMTTNSSEFYQQLGFKINNKQTILLLNREKSEY